MFCANTAEGQKIADRKAETKIKIIGPLTQSDFNYIRRSDITELDLEAADLVTIGNDNSDWNGRIENSFCDCYSLKAIVFPKNLKNIKKWAFYVCSSLVSVCVPKGVVSVDENAFSCCSSLSSVCLPEGLIEIGSNAFAYCFYLTSVNIPTSVKYIGQKAFQDCWSLSSVVLPEGIKYLDNTFCGCTALSSVNIPHSVTEIGKKTFYACSSLKFLEVPDTVVYIGSRAFSSSPLLQIKMEDNKVYFTKDNVLYVRGSRTAVSMYGSPKHIKVIDGAAAIENDAFRQCRSIVSVHIPKETTYIGVCAFWECESILSVKISSEELSIDRYAFEKCKSLIFLSLHCESAKIMHEAFNKCYSLKVINIHNSLGDGIQLPSSIYETILKNSGFFIFNTRAFKVLPDRLERKNLERALRFSSLPLPCTWNF